MSSDRNENEEEPSSPEYEQSFVKRMTNILPSTITKWFVNSSSCIKRSAKRSMNIEDNNSVLDSSRLGDETPAAKKMKLTPMSLNNSFPKMASSSTNTDITSTVITQPQKRNSISKRDMNPSTFESEPDELGEFNSEIVSKVVHFLNNALSSGDNSVTRTRKSLFDNSEIDGRKTENSNMPSYGSTFYSGKTVYGGAASNTHVVSPQINEEKTASNKVESSESLTKSISAKKIMDMLENYSSPLSEAKRISQYVNRDKSLTPNTIKQSENSFKTQELYVPHYASILSTKRKSRFMDTTNTARQLTASHSSTSKPSRNKLSNANGETYNKSVKQMKQKIVVPDPLPVNLTAALEINSDKLPNFTTFIKSSGVPNNTPAYESKNTADTTDSLKIDERSNSKNSHVDLEKPAHVFSINKKIPEFSFTNPEKCVEKVVKDAIKFSKSNAMGQENETKENNSTMFDGKQLEDNSKIHLSTTYEITQKRQQENQEVNEKSMVLETQKPDKTWNCDICWFVNNSMAKQCIACATVPTTESVSKESEKQATTNFMNKDNLLSKITKAQTEKWTCPICLVHNSNDKSRCVCCAAEKISNKVPAKFNFGTSNTTFKFGIDLKVNKDKKTIQETNNTVSPQPSLSILETIPKTCTDVFSNKVAEPETSMPLTPQSMVFTYNVCEAIQLPTKSTMVENTATTIKATVTEAPTFNAPQSENKDSQKETNFPVTNFFKSIESSNTFQKCSDTISKPLFGNFQLPSSTPLFTSSTHQGFLNSENQISLITASRTLFPETSSESTTVYSDYRLSEKVETTTPKVTLSIPRFSFGLANTQITTATSTKPSFNLTFVSSNKTSTPNVFNNTFTIPVPDKISSNFAAPPVPIVSETLRPMSNILPTSMTNTAMLGGNGLSGNTFVNDNPQNNSGSNLSNTTAQQTSSPGLFGIQNENNATNTNTNTNTNANANAIPNGQETSEFFLGSNMPASVYNNNVGVSTFGNHGQETGVFGMSIQFTDNAFSNSIPNSSFPVIFGNSLANSTIAPATSMFQQPSDSQIAGGFGAPSPFDTNVNRSVSQPSLNLSNGQSSRGVFGFTQPAQQQPQPVGVYGFTGAPVPQVQFKVGSAPNTTARRMRKAVRRTTQR
ncbi:unnamed protein product [Leptosia nina]|uniref:RanBP2-type domain-containing protein n=1 Tax=Leptosia nina TaxID=320188 RepID=A0AAV1K170_9NEOP